MYPPRFSFIAKLKPRLKSSQKTVDFNEWCDGLYVPWLKARKPWHKWIGNGRIYHACKLWRKRLGNGYLASSHDFRWLPKQCSGESLNNVDEVFFKLSTCTGESLNNVDEVFFFFSSLVSVLPSMSGSGFNSMCSKRGSDGVCENLSIVLSKNGNSLASSVSPLAILAH